MACLSNGPAYKAHASDLPSCSATTFTAAFGRLLKTPSIFVFCFDQHYFPSSVQASRHSRNSVHRHRLSAAAPPRCLALRQLQSFNNLSAGEGLHRLRHFSAAKLSILQEEVLNTFFARLYTSSRPLYTFFAFHENLNNTSPILQDENNHTFLHASNDRAFSPFAFEYDLNPVIHRPYLQTWEQLAIIGQDCEVSHGYFTASPERLGLDVTQYIDATSSTPSTQLTSPNDASTGWLETPATSPSANTSPLSTVTDSFPQREGSNFICCQCQEAFYRRCDLK